jgi:hypothetical protein
MWMRWMLPGMALLLLSAPAPAQQVTIRTLGQGAVSQIQQQRRVVVRTEAEWRRLWTQHAGAEAAPPAVDFRRDMVLAAFMGERPTGGFQVQIAGVRRDRGSLLVDVREQQPRPDDIVTQAFTAPFHLVAVPRSDARVVWGPRAPSRTRAR